MPARIGVAISTHNRRATLYKSLKAWSQHLPEHAVFVIVDDASDDMRHGPCVEDQWTVICQPHNLGVAMTKNRCIAELMDRDVDHLFLVDDDTWPIADDWWKPYVESPEQHLSYQWVRKGRNHQWVETWSDERHWSIGFPRGVMMYATADVINTVGGMDIAYGIHGGEHVDWQRRIHEAGYGTQPFMDVKGSDDLWFSLDKEQGGTVGSTIPLSERRRLMDHNSKLWDKSTAGFVPYRERVKGVQDYDMGPRLADTMRGVLDHVLAQRPNGVALEFGVGAGNSMKRIAKKMFAYGFDTWEGLPEKWREGFDAGMFSCAPPKILNTHLVPGMVQDTIRHFDFDQAGHIGLVHMDLDLYSSTAAVLEGVERRGLVDTMFPSGTYVVFDEWHGYPHDGVTGPEDHEQKAWREFAGRTGISWSVLGHGPEQWAIRIM